MNGRMKPSDEQIAKAASVMESGAAIVDYDARIDWAMEYLAANDESLKKLSATEGEHVAKSVAIDWIIAAESETHYRRQAQEHEARILTARQRTYGEG